MNARLKRNDLGFFFYAMLTCAVFLIICISGCSAPSLLRYSMEIPATALHPIGQTAVSDGRGRFREILCAAEADHGAHFPDRRVCEQILHRLSDEPEITSSPAIQSVIAAPLMGPPTVVFVPGIFGECVENIVTPFSDASAYLQSLGYIVQTIHVSGRSSSRYNAHLLKGSLDLIQSDRLIVIAYSKGVPDVLEMLATYPEMAKKVRALVSIAGVVSGTPLADKFSNGYRKLLANLPLTACPPGDGGGVDSISRTTRLLWLKVHKLPSSISLYSLVAFARSERISAPLLAFHKLLAQVDPLNDGQVIYYDAILPGSTLLGYVDADHWAVALPFNRLSTTWSKSINRNDFPREIVIESVLKFVSESAPP